MFDSRREAGRLLALRLANRLMAWREPDPVVLGIPRGGMVVADEVARALDAALDVLVVRKLGAPGDPEVGIGALVAGRHPEVVLESETIAARGVSAAHVCAEVERQLGEARWRETLLREGYPAIALYHRSVILVDDGLASGNTMRAAVRAARHAKPNRVVVAVPVASPDAILSLESLTDGVIALRVPREFSAVGAYYAEFPQVSDGEVAALLAAARARQTSSLAAAR